MPIGIENLKRAALLAIRFGQQIEESSKDGFKVSDLFSFIDEFAAIPAVVESKQAIIDEFKDLTPQERNELIAYVEAELKLENKKTEEIIEAALGVMISLLTLIEKLKK
jgi:hypothetical protein